MVKKLQACGMTQPQIAAQVGCSQSTISDIATGVTREPRYSIGEKLRHLLERAEHEKQAEV